MNLPFGNNLFKNVKGQGIVEFALVVPVLLMLVFGVVDFSRLALNKTLLDNTARETLRMASVGNDLGTITERTQKLVKPLVGDVTPSSPSDSIDDEGNPCTLITFSPTEGHTLNLYITPTYNSSLITGDSLRVSLSYRMDFLSPFWGGVTSPQDLKAVYYTQVEKSPS